MIECDLSPLYGYLNKEHGYYNIRRLIGAPPNTSVEGVLYQAKGITFRLVDNGGGHLEYLHDFHPDVKGCSATKCNHTVAT